MALVFSQATFLFFCVLYCWLWWGCVLDQGRWQKELIWRGSALMYQVSEDTNKTPNKEHFSFDGATVVLNFNLGLHLRELTSQRQGTAVHAVGTKDRLHRGTVHARQYMQAMKSQSQLRFFCVRKRCCFSLKSIIMKIGKQNGSSTSTVHTFTARCNDNNTWCHWLSQLMEMRFKFAIIRNKITQTA